MSRTPRLLVHLLAGNLVTALPLLAGIAYALTTMQQIGERQQALLTSSMSAIRTGDSIIDRLARLERAVRQHRVLADPGFREVAEIADRQLAELLDSSAQELPRTLQLPVQAVDALRVHLRGLPQLLDGTASDAELAAHFATAARLGAELRAAIQGAIESHRAELEAGYAAMRERIVVLGAVAVVLTIVTALLASLVVARPLRNLMGIVQRLGVGDWGRPVRLGGPADLVELGERLEWLRLQLIDADNQKKAFARDVTHELKTPLAAVIEAGSLLADRVPGPLNARQAEVLALLRSNAATLQEQIGQLLQYDSITHDHAEEAASYALREVADAAAAPLRDLAAQRQLHWDIAGVDLHCRVDARRLRLLLGNLLSNAVRHSPPGGRLSLHWERAARELVLSVTDDGDGIPAEHVDRIFDPFFTAGPREPQEARGTGLGLTIVRECVIQLGGSIRVSNAPGRGACFEVHLPLPPEARTA